jgi:hypothetical protein
MRPRTPETRGPPFELFDVSFLTFVAFTGIIGSMLTLRVVLDKCSDLHPVTPVGERTQPTSPPISCVAYNVTAVWFTLLQFHAHPVKRKFVRVTNLGPACAMRPRPALSNLKSKICNSAVADEDAQMVGYLPNFQDFVEFSGFTLSDSDKFLDVVVFRSMAPKAGLPGVNFIHDESAYLDTVVSGNDVLVLGYPASTVNVEQTRADFGIFALHNRASSVSETKIILADEGAIDSSFITSRDHRSLSALALACR